MIAAKAMSEKIAMNLDEALAIVLYLQDTPPGQRNEQLFSEAWGVVCHFALKFAALRGQRLSDLD